MAKKLPQDLTQEILDKYIPNYANNTLKVKGKVLNFKNINKKETEIGDVHVVDFMPQVKIKRWDNDANMSIRMVEDFDPSEPTLDSDKEKLLYKKDTFEARFYLLPVEQIEGISKASEFDVVFYAKPSSNRVEFTITTKNLVFHKQLPLTPDEIYEGVTRSQEIVNSYAVYYKFRAGGSYKNGKAFHIYRPIIYDANDNYTYGDIHINPGRDGETGTMAIDIPQEFLDNAVYPIIVDPTLGYTTLGGSSIGSKNTININSYLSPDNGVLTSMSLGITSGAGTGRSIKMGMWLTSDDSRVGYTNEIANSANGWNTVAFNGTPDDLTTTNYYLGWKSNVTQMKVSFDSTPGQPTWTDSDTYGNTMPDPLVPSTATARQWSIYATYAKTFTFTGDAALARRITETYTGDCLLVKTVVETFTGDCNLKKEVTGTYSGDANILNTLTKIFLSNSNLKKTIAGTFSGDASLAATTEETYTGDANLRKVVLQGFFGDANLLRLLALTFSGDAILVKTEAETFTGDANLLKVDVNTFTGDANLYGQAVNVFSGDASLERELVSTFTGDANLSTRYSNTFTGDANLFRADVTTTFTGDAYFDLSIQFSGDSNLVKTITTTFSGDAYFNTLSSSTWLGDSNLKKEVTDTFTGDAELAEIITGSFTGDANIAEVMSDTFTGDAHLAELISETFAGDANLLIEITDTFTGDAAISGVSSYTFTGDAALTTTIATLFTGSASLVREAHRSIVSSEWTASTQTGSFNDWTNPANALVDDSNYADATQTNAGSKYQSYHHFGFDIPTNADIVGIEIRYKHEESTALTVDGGLRIRVTKPDTTYDEKESPLSVLKSTNILGSSSDLWNMSFTPAEINSDDFMADVGVYSYITKTMTSFLYYIEARITYSIPNEFTGDASLLRIVDGQFTSQANLGGSGSGQFTGHASLLSTLPGQFTGDSSLERVGAGIWTGDANLEKTETETFIGEARLLGEGEAQFTGDAYLYDSDSRFLYGPWSYGAMFGGIIAGAGYYLDTFTGDANLYKTHDQQFYGDANLIKELIDSYTGDANLEKHIALTFTGDAHFAEIITGSFTGDSKLLLVIAGQFTGDAYIDYPSFTGDANFGKLVEETFLGDAALFKEYVGTFTGDASLLAVEVTIFTGDSNLVGETTTTFAGDASLQSEEAGTFTGDAVIKTVHTATFTGDASLLRIVEATYTSDASLITIVAGQFTGDANLTSIDIITTFTGDASILGVEPGTFTSDAYFTVEKVDTFAGVVVLESLDQFAGFAGTVDCISVAGAPGWGISGMEEFGLEMGI